MVKTPKKKKNEEKTIRLLVTRRKIYEFKDKQKKNKQK